MNFNALSSQTMLVHSNAWLDTPEVHDALASHPLSAAVLEQIRMVHDSLAVRQNTRVRVEARVAQLTEVAENEDRRHDRKVRAIYHMLQCLIEGVDDEALARTFQDWQARLLPDGLSLVRRSYLDEVGAVIELQKRITPAMLADMAKIQVGPLTLAALYRELVAAGEALGHAVRERAELQASVGRAGSLSSDIDSRGARIRWIRTASMLLDVLELISAPVALREKIRAPLLRSIQEATRARTNPDMPALDIPAGDELDAAPGDAGSFDAPADHDGAALAASTPADVVA